MFAIRLTMVASVLAGVGLTGYVDEFIQPQFTRLEIEIAGGFAYIPSPNERTLYIAYLGNVLTKEDTYGNPATADEVVCNVPQVGTELMVVRGMVDGYQGSKPMPQSRIFNLDKAKVTFSRMGGGYPSVNRSPWKPVPLKAPGHSDPAWKNLQYVPRIIDHPGLTNRKIIPDWKNDNKINGFMTLRGGSLEGMTPSNPIAEMAEFEFRVGTTITPVSTTDRTIYRVSVPGNNVDIRFNGATHGYTRLVLKPNAPGEAVRLRLRGLHAMNTPPKDGDELYDFCAFHSLLTPKVTSKDYVRIFYKAPDVPQGGSGMPSPGFYCNGDWF
jgi:hypothetical protein